MVTLWALIGLIDNPGAQVGGIPTLAWAWHASGTYLALSSVSAPPTSYQTRRARTMRQFLLAVVLVFFVAGCARSSNEPSGKSILEDRTAWKKLTKGMTQDKVQGILGEPLRIEKQGEITGWYYQKGEPLAKDEYGWVVTRGMLLFTTKGGGEARLTKWREP